MAALSAERRAERARDWGSRDASIRKDGEIVVADGFGITVRVNRGQLIVSDGVGRERRERRYSRATGRIARLVVLGGTGSVSLEALRWLTNIGAAVCCIDRDGRILVASAPSRSEAKLRRAQALASYNDTGLQLAKQLLHAKVAGQLQLAATELDANSHTVSAIEQSLHEIDAAETIQEIRLAESDAANAYWSCWRHIDVPFARADRPRIPEHWLRFGPRHSPLASGPRLATSPANAILNYLYALLETETRLACLTIGLDPALAIVHADDRGRDSLPLDLMEAIRPDVDRYLLDLLRNRALRSADFYETQRGNCRVLAPLTHELAQTLTTWRQLIGPITEHTATKLTRHVPRSETLPTRLTATNRHTANAQRHGHDTTATIPKPRPPEKRCKRCGGRLPRQTRTYCDTCIPHARRENTIAFITAGQTAFGQKANTTADTSHGGTAAKRRAASLNQNLQQAREWDAANPDTERDPAVFRRDILPTIQTTSLTDLARATGLGKPWLAEIRAGRATPHPRHWHALRTAPAQILEVTGQRLTASSTHDPTEPRPNAA